jgi:regulatory protein
MSERDSGRPRGGAARPAPSLASGLKARALYWLARREHSRHELQTKLKAHIAHQQPAQPNDEDMADEAEHTQHILDTVLDELEQAGWLSDSRTAQALVHSRQQRGLGVRRITQDLKRKGLDSATITTATADLHDTEVQRALALLQKRKGSIAALGGEDEADDASSSPRSAQQARQKAWQKHYQFLIRRGFTADVAQRALRLWVSDAFDDIDSECE